MDLFERREVVSEVAYALYDDLHYIGDMKACSFNNRNTNPSLGYLHELGKDLSDYINRFSRVCDEEIKDVLTRIDFRFALLESIYDTNNDRKIMSLINNTMKSAGQTVSLLIDNYMDISYHIESEDLQHLKRFSSIGVIYDHPIIRK